MPPDQAANVMQLPIIPMLLILVIWYVLILQPQRKKQKETQDMIKNLKKNDEVITASGIHGTVVIVKDKTVVVRVDENARIEFDKEAIITVKKSAPDIK